MARSGAQLTSGRTADRPPLDRDRADRDRAAAREIAELGSGGAPDRLGSGVDQARNHDDDSYQ
eukprot:CAMPEP_0175403142 /NCGR_PEP_ID=MMETSP0095-20121207/37876_1 /TAXON_ID=311494 /ORGANISM="Alexandrium monilatum, Strain CCMP3105" /LENGTH=62 /DNA_ID=CAMNT_0016701923 /DNA_START=91 /DNA_END=277 /DNA_ORIENTATION=+